MPVPDNVCVHCHKVFDRGHFRVVKVSAAAVDEGTIRVCSLLCLLQWTYAYGARMGARGVAVFRNAASDPASFKQAALSILERLLKG